MEMEMKSSFLRRVAGVAAAVGLSGCATVRSSVVPVKIARG